MYVDNELVDVKVNTEGVENNVITHNPYFKAVSLHTLFLKFKLVK